MANPEDYLAEPTLKFPKPWFRAKRLIGFDTGKHDLKREHEGWLVEAAHAIPADRDFGILIFGFASKLGFGGQTAQQSDLSNVELSGARASAAAAIMGYVNPRVKPRIDRFPVMAEGNQEYSAGPTDNSPYQRTVEVYVFLDDPPPPPPQATPLPDCPGGRRYRRWSIATPGGYTYSPFPGLAVAGNVVAFRREEGPPVIHFYLAPGVGSGFSYSGPKFGPILERIKKLFGDQLNPSGPERQEFCSEMRFNALA
jgi:hypothetical protein